MGISNREAPMLGEMRASKKDEIFSSSTAGYTMQEDRMMFLLLINEIPENIYRPICLPPPRYVEKMVKPSSCSGDMQQTVTKVRLNQYGFMPIEEELFDEHSCSLSLVGSSRCTDYFHKEFKEDDA